MMFDNRGNPKPVTVAEWVTESIRGALPCNLMWSAILGLRLLFLPHSLGIADLAIIVMVFWGGWHTARFFLISGLEATMHNETHFKDMVEGQDKEEENSEE